MKKKLKKSRRMLAREGTPPGYKPLSVRRPPCVTVPGEDAEEVIVFPDGSQGIQFLEAPLSEEECRGCLEKSFPGVLYAVILGILAAVFCVLRRGTMTPVIWLSGPTGSGKGISLELAGAILGEQPEALPTGCPEEKFWRMVGSACAKGQRLFQMDELGKKVIRGPDIAILLQLRSQTTWRRLYADDHRRTPTLFVVAITCASIPDHLATYDELNRRLSVMRLEGNDVDWAVTCGGAAETWCDRSSQNRTVGNSILTHAFKLAATHDFVWSKVAEKLGFGQLRDREQDEQRRRAFRELYEACRQAGSDMLYPSSDKTFGSGEWIQLDRVTEYVDACVNVDPESPARSRSRAVKIQLEALDCNRLLGISEPSIRCRILVHGSNAGIRFEEVGTLRGRERRNGRLPALAVDSIGVPGNEPPGVPTHTEDGAGALDGEVFLS